MAPSHPPAALLPERPPRALPVLGLLAIAAGAALSPAMLIALGPLSRSLTSSIGSVRAIAEFEVFLARIGLIAAGALALAVWSGWGRLRLSRPLAALERHVPESRPPSLALSGLLSPTSLFVGAASLGALAYLALAPHLLSAEARVWIEQEDGAFETVSALLFLGCAATSGALALRLRAAPRRSVHAVLALGFFLCAGEEASWGQRLLGFATPAALEEVNVQGEANLHNSFGYSADHAFVALVFAYGVLLPLLASWWPLAHRAADRLGIPVPSAGLAAGFAAISLLHDWTVYRVLPRGSLRTAEVRELLSAAALLAVQVEVWRDPALARRVDGAPAPSLEPPSATA